MGRGDRSGVQRRQGLGGGRFRVEREVQLDDFTKWLERAGGSPREASDRRRIRSILGMPVSRSPKQHPEENYKSERSDGVSDTSYDIFEQYRS